MAASLEKPYDFRPPGGQFSNLVGAPINTPATGIVTVDHMIHHVITSMTINTITAPWEGFSGPVYLIADSVFTWTTATGNIVAGPGTTLLAGRHYAFLYDRVTGKWYPSSVGH